jgi:hypothetical protein
MAKSKKQSAAEMPGTNLGNQGYMSRYAGRPVGVINVKSNDPSENTYDPTKIKKPNKRPVGTKVQIPPKK